MKEDKAVLKTVDSAEVAGRGWGNLIRVIGLLTSKALIVCSVTPQMCAANIS